MALDLAPITIKNKDSHVNADSVVRGQGYVVLFEPFDGTDRISLGLIENFTVVRDNTSEDFKIRPIGGGARETLFSTEVEKIRGFDIETYTHDVETLKLFSGGTAVTVSTGTFDGATVFDFGATGVTTGSLLAIESGGNGKSVVYFGPKGELTGTGTTGDDKPLLQFEFRVTSNDVTWYLPEELGGGNTSGHNRPHGVSVVMATGAAGSAGKVLLDSAPKAPAPASTAPTTPEPATP